MCNQDDCYTIQVGYSNQDGETIVENLRPNQTILINDFVSIDLLRRIA